MTKTINKSIQKPKDTNDEYCWCCFPPVNFADVKYDHSNMREVEKVSEEIRKSSDVPGGFWIARCINSPSKHSYMDNMYNGKYFVRKDRLEKNRDWKYGVAGIEESGMVHWITRPRKFSNEQEAIKFINSLD